MESYLTLKEQIATENKNITVISPKWNKLTKEIIKELKKHAGQLITLGHADENNDLIY